MPRDTNYFEEAYELCSHREQIIARTSDALYKAMRRRNVESGDEPKGQFNIRYFFLSLAQVISTHAESGQAESAISQESCAAINVCNVPSGKELSMLSDCHLSNVGIMGAYVALVSEQSQDEGDEFDLGYALRIACETINVETHDKILMKSDINERTAEMSDIDFDYWLSGFNSEQ